jgi:thiamine biosynthesis lipoprotein
MAADSFTSRIDTFSITLYMMNNRMIQTALCTWVLLFVSCNEQTAPTSAHFESMGTIVTVTPESILEPVQRTFNRIDAQMSEWKNDSPLAEVNRMAGVRPVQCPNEMCTHMLRVIEYAQETDGAFDPTWACLWDIWDFKNPTLPDKELIASRLPLIDWTKINVTYNTIYLEEKGMAIGLGGVAKGVALDIADVILRNTGNTDYMIQIGGQILARGISRTIGIRKPDGLPSEIIGSVKLTNQSISTSGDYENYFEVDGIRYHHIIHPKTGYPARGVRSVTVVANSASRADALSTAFFVLGVEDGLALAESMPSVEALFIDDMGEISKTTGFHLEQTDSKPTM